MTLDQYFEKTLAHMFHPAMGILPYPFITPSAITDLSLDRQQGGYGQQYDWDTYFIGIGLAKKKPEKMEAFRDALLNFISFVAPDGHTPRTLSPFRFYDPFDHHKPFLAQGIMLAAESLHDHSWITPDIWKKLTSYMGYWENRRGFHGLVRWRSAMESGADNNPTTVNLPDLAAESVDANTYYYLELLAMIHLAKELKKPVTDWEMKAKRVKHSMNEILWNDEHQSYYDVLNFSDAKAEHLVVNSWTNFVPLWAGIPEKDQAEAMVKKWLTNEEEFLGTYGLRTVAKSDPLYSTAKRAPIYIHAENRRWIVSNWMGPLWVLPNWIITEGMERYGFKKEADDIRDRVLQVLEKDLSENEMLHENYNAETGKALWARNFGSWNLLAWTWGEA